VTRAPIFALLMVLAACGSFRPQPLESVGFLERSETRTEEGVTVTVAVLTGEESEQVFGRSLANKGIQPVWVSIVNRTDERFYVFPISLDPDYFSPYEAAWMRHITWGGSTNDRIDDHFVGLALPLLIRPGSTSEGFVFTHLDLGAKAVSVDLLGERTTRQFAFLVAVPGLRADWQTVDFENLYEPEEITDYSDHDAFRAVLEGYPRAVRDSAGEDEGDPLNVVLIGEGRAVLAALVRRGWHMTETMYGSSAWKTTWSFLFGSRYRYSPISALYVFGRRQDVALQKARSSIHERNHMRLWLAPVTWNGKPVWLGQISRDIGVRWTWRTITTHKIDPDVDETRGYLVQDLIASQHVASVGWVKGVGAAPRPEPRHNLTGDPYFTDGLRLVALISNEPMGLDEVQRLDWERLPPRSGTLGPRR
jgi:hypothetical protein